MCEYNRPYPFRFGHHPDDIYGSSTPEVVVQPPEAFIAMLGTLAVEQSNDIKQAVEDAAAIAADVHLYRSEASPFLGIALRPGEGPRVKVWEH